MSYVLIICTHFQISQNNAANDLFLSYFDLHFWEIYFYTRSNLFQNICLSMGIKGLIIDLYFLIPAVIRQIFEDIPKVMPTKKTKSKMETLPVTVEAEKGRC